MEHADQLQQCIQDLAAHYGVDLSIPGAWLTVSRAERAAVTFHNVDGSELLLTLTDSDGQSSLQVVLFINGQRWAPLSCTLYDGSLYRSARIDADGELDIFDEDGYAMLNRGCRFCAANIRDDYLTNSEGAKILVASGVH